MPDDYGEYLEPCGPIDYEVDEGTIESFTILWAMELDGDTIATSSFDLDGLTQDSASFDDESATVFIDFNGAREGNTYCITHTITTDEGRTLKKRIRIRVRQECVC
jgi:hypothetical protein